MSEASRMNTQWKAARERLMGSPARAERAVETTFGSQIVPVMIPVPIYIPVMVPMSRRRIRPTIDETEAFLKRVLGTVARRLRVPPKLILSSVKRREDSEGEARLVCYWLAYRLSDASLPLIGRFFGRSHSTVIRGIRRVDERQLIDERFADVVGALVNSLTWDHYDGEVSGLLSWRKAKRSPSSDGQAKSEVDDRYASSLRSIFIEA